VEIFFFLLGRFFLIWIFIFSLKQYLQ
jgi:hypothetical protein